MSTARKPSPLETLEADTLRPVRQGSSRTPLEHARARLGGRAVPSLGVPGSLVEADMRDGVRRAGVILWSSHEHCEAWFDDGFARRVSASAVSPSTGPVPESLLRVAAEIRVFVGLVAGERVKWSRGGEVAEGCIAEKCRYGAIVVTPEGRLVAVGFRKLWPATARGTA
ncbi:MAG: hypothetical protein FWD17_03505 [Polyangiaceae bacterium]|nr:hypothetical protein [Polyangiaceae bacterium]